MAVLGWGAESLGEPLSCCYRIGSNKVLRQMLSKGQEVNILDSIELAFQQKPV